jgi:hypothetical protein
MGNGGGLFPGSVISIAKPKIDRQQSQFRHAMNPIFDQFLILPALSHWNETL